MTKHVEFDPAESATPAAESIPGYVPGLDVVTAADARERQETCFASSDADECDATVGCDYWEGRCGIDCGRLATSDACAVSDGCGWDERTRHCSWRLPECGPAADAAHCDATKFCTYDIANERCVSRTYECGDLESEDACKRSETPRCAWNSEEGTCADLRQCETIRLPRDCPTHKGCAYSQSRGACVSLGDFARDKPMCVRSEDCDVADTFCNMDFGSKGYCQNCLPLVGDGVEVCDDDAKVAAPGTGECRMACFPETARGLAAGMGKEPWFVRAHPTIAGGVF